MTNILKNLDLLGISVVPKEATPTMMCAGVEAARKELPAANGAIGHVQIRAAWRAMVAAAASEE